MTAIITDHFKQEFVQQILDDVVDSATNYYIGIGRSQDWDSSDTAPSPLNNVENERNFRLNMQSVKKVEDVSFVAGRFNWSSGAIYNGYDNSQVGYNANPHYVLTNNTSIYICLQQGKSATGAAQASTVEPTGAATTSFKTADGYVWKFLYTLSGADSTKFLSANYLPVKLQGATNVGDPANQIEQLAIQNAAIAGQISNIAVTAGGTGYTSAPTVTIIGNGDSAQATATINGGAVVKIDMNDSAATIFHGSGYDYAHIAFSGGGGANAAAQPNLSPRLGFGKDPRVDLKSTAIVLNIKPVGAENNDFIIGQDFRQVGLMKNPIKGANDSDFSSATGNALTTMTLSAVSAAFTVDKTISGATSGAKAYVDRFDSDTIYYHQTPDTGFTAFVTSEAVSEDDGSGAGTIASPLLVGDIDKYKGEVFYIDNRASIERSAAQTEDLKIIIQL